MGAGDLSSEVNDVTVAAQQKTERLSANSALDKCKERKLESQPLESTPQRGSI